MNRTEERLLLSDHDEQILLLVSVYNLENLVKAMSELAA